MQDIRGEKHLSTLNLKQDFRTEVGRRGEPLRALGFRSISPEPIPSAVYAPGAVPRPAALAPASVLSSQDRAHWPALP